jgi:hypothetical protein
MVSLSCPHTHFFGPVADASKLDSGRQPRREHNLAVFEEEGVISTSAS